MTDKSAYGVDSAALAANLVDAAREYLDASDEYANGETNTLLPNYDELRRRVRRARDGLHSALVAMESQP